MRLAILLFLTTLCIVLLLSCSAPKALEYRDCKNFTVQKLGVASSFIKMDLVYYNPNNFALQLKRTDLDVFLDSTYLGHATQEYQVTIPNRSDFNIPIQMEVDMKNVFRNALLAIFNQNVLIRLTGNIKVGKANIFKSFPVNYEGRQQFTFF